MAEAEGADPSGAETGAEDKDPVSFTDTAADTKMGGDNSSKSTISNLIGQLKKNRKKKEKKKSKKSKYKYRADRFESNLFLMRLEGTLFCATIVSVIILVVSIIIALVIIGTLSQFRPQAVF